MNTQAEYTNESRGVAMNLFAVLGFVAILLAGLWATIQLVKQVSRISTDFSLPTLSLPWFNTTKLTLKEVGELVSGEPAEIAWTLKARTEGTLAFTYACRKDAYIKVAVAEDTYQAIPCNAPYALSATSSSLAIIPVVQDAVETETMEIPFSLTYKMVGGKEKTASDVLVVRHTALPQPPVVEEEKEGVVGTRTIVEAPKVSYAPTTPAPAPTQYRTVEKVVAVRNSDPNGMSDLAVSILDSGLVSAGKYAVKFEVANLGTKLASGWTFTATLPTNPTYTYVSAPQQALYAGEKMDFVLTFDKVQAGAFLLTVDANNAITESVEKNNALTHTVAF